MTTNSVFFPQTALDVLIALEQVDLEGEELVLPDGYRYGVVEAVRVLIEVTTGEDPLGLCGRVRTREELTESLGAELLGDSMLVDDSAYDIVNGFLGTPSSQPGGDSARSEEEVLTAVASCDELSQL